MNNNRAFPFIVVALLALVAAVVVATRPPAPPATPTVNDVAAQLYCPLCQGLTVDVCELQVCDDMRQTISQKLAAGESPEQIQSYFVEQYGQKVVAKPSTEGFHLTAWVMPFLFLLAALAAVVAWLRSRSAPPVRQPVRAASPYDERLERELQRLEE